MAYFEERPGQLRDFPQRQGLTQHEGPKTQAEWDKIFSLGFKEQPREANY